MCWEMSVQLILLRWDGCGGFDFTGRVRGYSIAV